MAEDVASLGLKVDSDQVTSASERLDGLSSASARAEKKARELSGGVRLLTGALGALGISLGLMAVREAADSWSDMNSRLGLAVGGAEKATAVMSRLQDVAKNTYSDINTTTESFIANASVLRDLGKSTSQALDYTEALNNALVVSGAKADTAASVQEALSRAMALGKLSGETLNTVIAKGGEVASVIAKELGVSTLQLRKLGEQGKITGDVLYSSLTNRLEELRDKAGEMPATMQDAVTAWSNAFTVIVGTVDAATGASGALGQALYDLGYQVADQASNIATAFVSMQMLAGNAFSAITMAFSSMFGNFDTGSALMIAGVGLGTTAFLGLAATIMGPVIGAFSALTLAIMANPIGLLIGAFAAVTMAAFLFRDELTEIIGVDIIDEVKRSVNIIIGAFVAAYKSVVKHWENLPAAFAIIGKKAWNSFLEQFKTESLWVEAFGTKYTLFEGLNLDRFKADISDDAKDISDDLSNIWKTSMATNWAGEIKTGLSSVWRSAEEVTQQFKNMNAELNGDGGEGVGGALGDAEKGTKGKRDRTAEKLKKEMEERLEVLTEYHRAEEDLLAEKYLKDIETLNWARENEKISQDEYNAFKLGVEAKFQADLQAIKLQEFSSALSATGDFFGAMSALQAGGNEKMLKAQKIFSAASALVNAYLAATQALATPGIGPWGQIAAYASVLAAGLGAVAAIKGGGKGSSGGGGGGSASSQPQANAAPPEQKPIKTQAVEIKLQGEVYSREAVAELMNKMNDLSSDGFKLIIGTS